MNLKDPIVAYVAEGNIEAHQIVDWLRSNGINAYAVEDNSGASLWALGPISQFHKPKVWVDKSDSHKAGLLLVQFEVRKNARRKGLDTAPPIESTCEECGETSAFAASLNGTTQDCPKCHAYMDVGEFKWPGEDEGCSAI